MIKDHRFDVSMSNVQAILDGDMKEFLEEIMTTKMYKDYKIIE